MPMERERESDILTNTRKMTALKNHELGTVVLGTVRRCGGETILRWIKIVGKSRRIKK
jgi:hypothetical protein